MNFYSAYLWISNSFTVFLSSLAKYMDALRSDERIDHEIALKQLLKFDETFSVYPQIFQENVHKFLDSQMNSNLS